MLSYLSWARRPAPPDGHRPPAPPSLGGASTSTSGRGARTPHALTHQLVVLCALALAVVGLVTPLAPRAAALETDAQGRLVLDSGNVDMLNLVSDSRGRLSLNLKEDVTGTHVTHDPASVLLKVREAALRNLPAGLPGYVLPQTQDPRLVWPGWDTQGIAAGGYEKARFNVSYTGPDGGRISMFLTGALGATTSRLADGGYELRPSGSTILQDYPAHTHVNWVFSKAGRYTLTVSATATGPGGRSATTRPVTYTIDVGSFPCTGKAAAPAPSKPAPGGSGAPGVANPSGLISAPATSGTQDGAAAGTGGASGGTGAGLPTGSGASQQCLPTTITREATEDEAKTLAAAAGGSSSKGGSAVGSSESKGAAAGVRSTSTTLTFKVGPGASGGASSGHFDLGPAIENGALVARVKDDRRQPATWVDPSSLTFALGDAASLTAPSALSFVAKPGQKVWMVPSTQIPGVPWLGLNSQREEIVNGTTGGVTFTLSSVSGPGRLAVFNAGGLGGGVGQHVFDGPGSSYTLPANTHAHQNWVFTQPGTYTVTLTISVNAKAGAVSSAATGGSGSAQQAPALKATGEKGPHGRPMVEEVVGRTPSGEPCDPNASLARTGADGGALLGASALLLLVGAGVLRARRRVAVRSGR